MTLSALDEKSQVPNEKLLASVLGRTLTYWLDLRDFVEAEFGAYTEQWNFSGPKYGWSLRLILKKRTIVYLIPQKGCFLAGFVLGEKAFAEVHCANLPHTVLDVIDAAPKYGEGRGFRLSVRTKKDLESIKTLTGIKIAN